MASLRILVVDDNALARAMLKEMLESRGHTVVAEAGDPAGAVKAFTSSKPDLVTLDLSLTDGEGSTVLDSIRKIDPKAKVIVISGNAQKKLVQQLLAAGASGFIEKPFQGEDLSREISRLVPS